MELLIASRRHIDIILLLKQCILNLSSVHVLSESWIQKTICSVEIDPQVVIQHSSISSLLWVF